MTSEGEIATPSRWLSFILFAAAIIVTGVFLFTRNPGNGFAFDDWSFVATRNEISWTTLTESHYGHFVALPVIVYVTCFRLFGLDDYEVFRVIAILVHLATAFSVGVLLRRRHGLLVAISVSLLVGSSGIGAQNPLWGFQIGFMGGFLFLVLAVMVFDGDTTASRTKTRPLIALLLFCATACAGSGIGALLAFGFLMLIGKKMRQFWWAVGLPSAIYAAWYLSYGDSDPTLRPTATQLVSFVIDGLSGSLSGLFGVDIMWGRMALGALVLCSFLDWRRNGFSARKNVWWVYVIAFWTLTGVKRAIFLTPLTSRYLWVSSIALLLQFAEYVPDGWIAAKRRSLVATLGISVVLLGSWGSYPTLAEYRNFQRGWVEQSTVQNAVLLANRERIDPVIPAHSLGGIHYDTAAGFFSAVDRFGEPDSRSVKEILESTALRFGAEISMTELGLMDVTASATPCHEGVAIRKTTVPEGTAIVFRVTRPTTVTVSRFVDNQDALVSNVRLLDRGTYSIELGLDGFGLPIRAHFDAEVTRCE